MLPELRAEQQLLAIEAASVPHMTADGRRDTLDRYQRQLGEEHRPRRATADDLRAMGFQVREVPVKAEEVSSDVR